MQIPEQAHSGSILKNVVFEIFHDGWNIDSKMNGFHHTLTVDLCTMSYVQYTFIEGKCTIPKLQLPEDSGLLEFKAFHSWRTELFVHIKVIRIIYDSWDSTYIQCASPTWFVSHFII